MYEYDPVVELKLDPFAVFLTEHVILIILIVHGFKGLYRPIQITKIQYHAERLGEHKTSIRAGLASLVLSQL